MTDESTISFAKDIRPMFTDIDVEHMKGLGIDLSSYDAVQSYAEAIYRTVSNGTMPPPGTGGALDARDVREVQSVAAR